MNWMDIFNLNDFDHQVSYEEKMNIISTKNTFIIAK